MKNLRQLLPYLKQYKLWTFLGSCLVFLEVIMDLFLPSIMANIVNVGIGNRDSRYIIICVILMLILTILGILGGIFSTYYTAKATNSVCYDLKNDLFKKLTQFSFLQFDQLHVGHLVTIITNDILLVGDIFMMGIRILLRVPIILFGSIIMAIFISPKLSLILLIVIPLMTLFIVWIMKKAFPYFDLTQESIDQVNSVVRDNINGIRVVKAFVNEDREIKRFEKVNTRLMNINLKAMRIMTITMPVMMLVINIAIVIVLWMGGTQYIHGQIQLGTIMAFIQYLTNILSAIMMGSIVLVMFTKGEVSASRVNSIIHTKVEPSIGQDCDWMQGRIEFSNVNFKYQEGTGDLVLKDIDLTVIPGEFLGIVGSIGSGKSTLIHLMLRFYDVKDGMILLDGKPLSNYSISHLREKIGICMQKPYLYSGTIADYITAESDFHYDEIQKVLEIACADQFVFQKPDQILEKIEPLGSNFSGGEKQRLALARTLYQNPELLILDDSLSAVDLQTEQTILRNIKQYHKNKTLVLVSSRVASVMHADRIVVMDDGKIVGIGSHEELLRTNSVYQDIYHSCMKGID